MVKKEGKSFWKKNELRFFRLASQIFSFIILNIGLFFSAIGLFQIFPSSGIIIPIEQGFPSPFSSISGTYNLLEYYISNGFVPYLIAGTLFIFGILFGRSTCSWICPFGFIQETIAQFPQRKIKPPQNTENLLSNAPYFIIALSLFLVLLIGINRLQVPLSAPLGPASNGPYTMIDPYITLNSIIPWKLINKTFPVLGQDILAFFGQDPLLWVQIIFLLIILMMNIWIPKVFCRWLCPTGAILGILNEYCWFGLKRDPVRCLKEDCKICEDVCPMNIPLLKLEYNRIKHRKCDYCLKCVENCPENALRLVPF